MFKAWVNRDNTLWLRVDDGFRWLNRAGVSRLDISHGRALIIGTMPYNKGLADLSPGFSLCIVCRQCGQPDKPPREQEIVVSMDRCRIIKCWIPSIVPVYAENSCLVGIRLLISCQITIHEEKE